MKRNERILKTFLLALSSTLIMKYETLNVRASDDKKAIFKEYHSDEEIEKEKIYRYEHQIEDEVELINLSDKQLIKTICGDETKYYLCNEEYSYIKENVNYPAAEQRGLNSVAFSIHRVYLVCALWCIHYILDSLHIPGLLLLFCFD